MERLIKTWDEGGHKYNAIIACENQCKNNHTPSCYCAPMMSIRKRLAAYEDTGLTPEEITVLKSERDALVERCRGTIPVHCSDCELWGSNGWSQYGVGYCEGDDKPHEGTDFCSYGKEREA